MKWILAFTVLVLAQPAGARDLKAPRAPDAGAVLSKQLEAENEGLRRRNEKLEAMMQMARSEVQRMDAAAARSKKHVKKSYGDSEVLDQEIQDLRTKLRTSEADKNDLVQTLRRMLAKNSTQIFEKQAEKAQQMNMALELKSGNDRRALQEQVKAALGKRDEAKELAQTLQDENSELRAKLQDAAETLARSMKMTKELSSDKASLVATMQALMRENSRFKHALQKETDLEKKDQKELTSVKTALSAEEAKLAKLAIDKKKAADKKKGEKGLMRMYRHHRHERMTAADKKHMQEIDKYIDRADEDDDDDDSDDFSEQQLKAVRKEDELIKKGQVGAHLSDFLGFKSAAAKIGATKIPDNKVLRKKPKPIAEDGGESEAEDLVAQAKEQLAAMEQRTD